MHAQEICAGDIRAGSPCIPCTVIALLSKPKVLCVTPTCVKRIVQNLLCSRARAGVVFQPEAEVGHKDGGGFSCFNATRTQVTSTSSAVPYNQMIYMARATVREMRNKYNNSHVQRDLKPAKGQGPLLVLFYRMRIAWGNSSRTW